MKKDRSQINQGTVKVQIPWEKALLRMEANMKEGLLRNGYSDSYAASLSRWIRKSGGNLFSTHFALKGIITLNQYPLGSMGASGKFDWPDAGLLVYVRQTGKRSAYTRKWVRPKDPKTLSQLLQRERLKQADTAWHLETPELRQAWNQAATGKSPLIGYTYYIKSWFNSLKSTGIPPSLGLSPQE